MSAQRNPFEVIPRYFFSRGYGDIGTYSSRHVNLELLPGDRPQFVKPCPVPWAREEQLKSQLDELQSCGVFEEGEPSDWNSPIILVPKGKGKQPREFRILVVKDMRSLNKCLVPETFVFQTLMTLFFRWGLEDRVLS